MTRWSFRDALCSAGLKAEVNIPGTRLGINVVINRVLGVAGESWNGGEVKHSAFWTDWLTMFMSCFAGLFVESRESLIIFQRTWWSLLSGVIMIRDGGIYLQPRYVSREEHLLRLSFSHPNLDHRPPTARSHMAGLLFDNHGCMTYLGMFFSSTR